MASFPTQQFDSPEHDVIFSPTLSQPMSPIVAAEASFSPFAVAGFEAPDPKAQLFDAQAQEIALLRERFADKEKELDELNTKSTSLSPPFHLPTISHLRFHLDS